MATLKQIAEKVVATQYQPITPGIKQKAFEILEEAGYYTVSQIIKSRE